MEYKRKECRTKECKPYKLYLIWFNTSGLVLLDIKSITMCVRFKHFDPQFWLFLQIVLVYMSINIDNSQILCADQYVLTFRQELVPKFVSTWFSFLNSLLCFINCNKRTFGLFYFLLKNLLASWFLRRLSVHTSIICRILTAFFTILYSYWYDMCNYVVLHRYISSALVTTLIVPAAFYGDRDIKMDNSVFRTN